MSENWSRNNKPKNPDPPRHRPEAVTKSPLLEKADDRTGQSYEFFNSLGYKRTYGGDRRSVCS